MLQAIITAIHCFVKVLLDIFSVFVPGFGVLYLLRSTGIASEGFDLAFDRSLASIINKNNVLHAGHLVLEDSQTYFDSGCIPEITPKFWNDMKAHVCLAKDNQCHMIMDEIAENEMCLRVHVKTSDPRMTSWIG